MMFSSNLTTWFTFISYSPEIVLLAVEGVVNMKCRHRDIEKKVAENHFLESSVCVTLPSGQS